MSVVQEWPGPIHNTMQTTTVQAVLNPSNRPRVLIVEHLLPFFIQSTVQCLRWYHVSQSKRSHDRLVNQLEANNSNKWKCEFVLFIRIATLKQASNAACGDAGNEGENDSEEGESLGDREGEGSDLVVGVTGGLISA
ncbi:hypothetical protein ACMFMF_009095 [Clarireedia jacksonii]